MINKELKKLNRRELVEIIYRMKKNEQEMKDEVEQLQSELDDKRIRVSEAGSLAEATMSVTDVFAAAQKTADIYLNEIVLMREETEKKCAKMLDEAANRVEIVLAEGERQFEELKARYHVEYEKYRKLQEEIHALELMKKYGIDEGM